VEPIVRHEPVSKEGDDLVTRGRLASFIDQVRSNDAVRRRDIASEERRNVSVRRAVRQNAEKSAAMP